MLSDLQDKLETARRLLRTAEQAHGLAEELHREIIKIREWDRGPRVTELRYSLGISHGDVEIAANRLGGLKNELQQLVRLLEGQAGEAERF